MDLLIKVKKALSEQLFSDPIMLSGVIPKKDAICLLIASIGERDQRRAKTVTTGVLNYEDCNVEEIG